MTDTQTRKWTFSPKTQHQRETACCWKLISVLWRKLHPRGNPYRLELTSWIIWFKHIKNTYSSAYLHHFTSLEYYLNIKTLKLISHSYLLCNRSKGYWESQKGIKLIIMSCRKVTISENILCKIKITNSVLKKTESQCGKLQ